MSIASYVYSSNLKARRRNGHALALEVTAIEPCFRCQAPGQRGWEHGEERLTGHREPFGRSGPAVCANQPGLDPPALVIVDGRLSHRRQQPHCVHLAEPLDDDSLGRERQHYARQMRPPRSFHTVAEQLRVLVRDDLHCVFRSKRPAAPVQFGHGI